MKKSLLCCLLLASACGNPAPGTAPSGGQPSAQLQVDQAERVTPPFAVRGDAEGLLLIWYDESGAPHPASKRSEVPQAQRARVRVDSLEVPPDKRLDPAFVYVADLRAPAQDGSYAVRKVSRDALEQAVQPEKAALAAAASQQVIIYGASWCGACKQAARYLRSKGVPFIEKDIEKEPGARSEMLAKAKAQGVNASGIPVIDVRGKLLGGFDPGAVDRLLARK